MPLSNCPIGRPRAVEFQPREYDRILHFTWDMAWASELHQAPFSPPLSWTRLLSAFLKARVNCQPPQSGFAVTLPNGSIRREIPLFGAMNPDNAWPVLPGPGRRQSPSRHEQNSTIERETGKQAFLPPGRPQRTPNRDICHRCANTEGDYVSTHIPGCISLDRGRCG